MGFSEAVKSLRLFWAVLALVGLAISFVLISKLFAVNSEWVEKVDVPSASYLDGSLLQRMIDEELVWIERDIGRIRIVRPHCNAYVLENPTEVKTIKGLASKLDANSRREISKLVQEFCGSDLGARIASNIDIFNGGGDMFAIRDDRALAAQRDKAYQCHSGETVSALFIPRGCFRSGWKIRLSDGKQEIRTIPADSIPMDDYYIMSASLPRAMSDWAVVKPFRDLNGAVRHEMTTRFEHGGKSVRFDFLGHVEALTIGGHPMDMSPLASASSGTLAAIESGVATPFTLAFERICKGPKGKVINCVPARQGEVFGLRFTLTPETDIPTDVILTVLPGGQRITRADDTDTADPNRDAKMPRWSGMFRKISVSCDALTWPLNDLPVTGASTQCRMNWEAGTPAGKGNRGGRREKTPFEMVVDGRQILTPSGNLTTEGFVLGFGDILGYGIDDIGSYADYLSTRDDQVGIGMTIRPGLQERLLKILDSRRANARSTERADIVVVDADGDDAGALLGFASRPARNAGLSHWDMLALARARPALSPFASHAWVAHNELATPGSTFKLVTGLAAIQYILDEADGELAEVMLGRAKPAKAATRLGWVQTAPGFRGACKPMSGQRAVGNMNAMPIYRRTGGPATAHCIGNFGRAPAANYLLPGTHGCRPGDRRARTGLCEAIVKSSNLFFAGLSMEIGKSVLYTGGREVDTPRLEGLPLDRMVQRLFGPRVAGDPMQTIHDALDPGFSVRRARASAMSMTVTRPMGANAKRNRGIELALAGIGQAVSATPLAMASMAASVATGKVVKPYAITHPDIARPPMAPLIKVPVGQEPLYEELRTHLLRGMNGVALRGTGRGAVSGLPGAVRDAVYIKTGTADISDGMNAAWIVGFIRPPGGNSGIDRTVAFACRVAPVRGGGGKICAPIIRDMIKDLHANGI